MKTKLTSLFSIITIVSFAVFAGFSLLHKGLPPTHDGEYHVVRFYEFDKVLRDGNLYPRWAPDLNNGYGVPLFNFVYPLPNYFASFLHLFGISFIDAFKLSMFIATIIGAVFFYLWTKIFWGKLGGIVSSVFYTFSPYHFVDIYIRGSVGEVWALAFFPAFLWSITELITKKRKNFIAPSGIFFALVIFSHNILAIMFSVFAVSYMAFLISRQREKRSFVVWSIKSLLIGLGLSAIFWLPAIFEKQYVVGLQLVDPTDHFPELYQLLFPSWGAGFQGGNLGDQMSFQIGVANLVVFFISIFIAISHVMKKVFSWIIIFFIIWFALIFYLMMPASLFIWDTVPLMNYFQFPWRLLSLEILVASFLAGSIVYVSRSSVLGIVMILFVFLLGIGYVKPAYYHDRSDGYYISRSNFMHGTNSLGDAFNTIWLDQSLKKRKANIIIEKGMLTSSVIKPTSRTFFVSINSESNVTVNIAYFPSWAVFIDGKKILTKPDNNGLISFFVPGGNHIIDVQFETTTARTLAGFLFLLSLFFVLFYISKWYNLFIPRIILSRRRLGMKLW